MKASVESLQSIKINGDAITVRGSASIDLDDDGKRDIPFSRVRVQVDPDLSVSIGGTEYTAEQAVAIVRKLALKALRKEAKRLTKVGDDMPADIEDEPVAGE